MRRLLNQKADLLYLQKELDKLPKNDNTFKANFIVATMRNEVYPSKLTESEVRLFNSLGINTNILSHESITVRPVHSNNTAAKRRKGLKSLPVTAIVYALLIAAGLTAVFVSINSTNKGRIAEREVREAAQRAQLEDCQAKAPYYQWKTGTLTQDGYCFRVRYPSKQACIDDGREKSGAVKPERYADSYVRVTTCRDDGTWVSRSYSPEDQDYREREAIRNLTGTSCVDVTSYDYNWDNDMLCTHSDGSQFFTSYEGAINY